MKCPKRKIVISNKREARKNITSFSQAVTKSTTSMPSAVPAFSNEAHLKIYTCMIHAHIVNIAEPGSYEKELNATLKANNLPMIKIPNNPPSSKFLNKLSQLETTRHKEDSPAEEHDDEEESENETVDVESHEETATTSHSNTQETKSKRRKMKGKDLGLIIHTSRSEGWPANLVKQQLIQGINEKKYKVTFSENLVEEKEILELIRNDDIELKECWKITEDDIFRKIRSGITKDRTPPSRTERRTRKKL